MITNNLRLTKPEIHLIEDFKMSKSQEKYEILVLCLATSKNLKNIYISLCTWWKVCFHT